MKKIRLDEEEEGVPSTALREVAVLMELGQSTKPGADCIVKYAQPQLLSLTLSEHLGSPAVPPPSLTLTGCTRRQLRSVSSLGPTPPLTPSLRRLLDVIHSDARLCLVFEFLDLDLKKYMDAASLAADQTYNAQATQRANAQNGALAGLVKAKTRARRGLPADLVAVGATSRCKGWCERVADGGTSL